MSELRPPVCAEPAARRRRVDRARPGALHRRLPRGARGVGHRPRRSTRRCCARSSSRRRRTSSCTRRAFLPSWLYAPRLGMRWLFRARMIPAWISPDSRPTSCREPAALAVLLDRLRRARTARSRASALDGARRVLLHGHGELAASPPRPPPRCSEPPASTRTSSGASAALPLAAGAPTRSSIGDLRLGRHAGDRRGARAPPRHEPDDRRHERPRARARRRTPTSSCRCWPARRRAASRAGRTRRRWPCCTCWRACRLGRAAARGRAPRRRSPTAGGAWLDELLALVGDGPGVRRSRRPSGCRRPSSRRSCSARRRASRADGCETGDWLHVDVYLTRPPGYRALLFPGSRYDGEVMTWARERASSIVAVGRTTEGAALHVPVPDDPLVAVLVETMVAELAACELWRAVSTRRRGPRARGAATGGAARRTRSGGPALT